MDTVEVYPGEDGQWYWHRQAPNGEVISDGEGYVTEEGARQGAVRANPDFTAETVTVREQS